MSVGYLLHAFDLLNVGDLDLVRQVRARCDHLVVGVLGDADAAAVSGRTPVVPEHERVSLVAHLRGVEAAVRHGDDSVPMGAQVFALAEVAVAMGLDVVELTSDTESASVLLREALRPVRSAVA